MLVAEKGKQQVGGGVRPFGSPRWPFYSHRPRSDCSDEDTTLNAVEASIHVPSDSGRSNDDPTKILWM